MLVLGGEQLNLKSQKGKFEYATMVWGVRLG